MLLKKFPIVWKGENLTEEEVASYVRAKWEVMIPTVIGTTRACELSKLTSDSHDQVSFTFL